MDITLDPQVLINELSSRVNELTQENIVLRSLLAQVTKAQNEAVADATDEDVDSEHAS
jgi:hypothetical protein